MASGERITIVMICRAVFPVSMAISTSLPVAEMMTGGMSLVCQGQPRYWFAVNRWVSGGQWLEREALSKALQELSAEGSAKRVATWLNAMLRCYADDLLTLCAERDANLIRIMAGSAQEEVFNDKNEYLLAQQVIDLASDIHGRLHDAECL